MTFSTRYGFTVSSKQAWILERWFRHFIHAFSYLTRTTLVESQHHGCMLKCTLVSKRSLLRIAFFSASTADLWSSRTIKPYLNYIDNEWTLQSYHLQAHFMPESYTGEHISESLLLTLKELNLDSDKQIVITTDNVLFWSLLI